MLGILGESFIVAARADSLRHPRGPQGVVENPARHDPERAWIAADQRRRNARREARARRRANLGFWRGRRWLPGQNDGE